MIQPAYITSILKQNNFNVHHLNGIDTGGIVIHMFSVSAAGTGEEIVTVQYAKAMGNKVSIETENGTSVLGQELTRELEEAILMAVSTTPENRFANLLNPIFFLSNNFSNISEYDINEERFEEDFMDAIKPLDEEVASSQKSFFVLSFPVNKYSKAISNFFGKVSSLHTITEKNNTLYVQFNAFNSKASNEFKIIHQVKKSLASIGVITEVVDLLEV